MNKPPILIAKAMRIPFQYGIVVPHCPFCNDIHYHGDGTGDGTGSINGTCMADCGKGQYELEEI